MTELLLRVGRLVDGTGAPPVRDQEILVRDGAIAAIGPAGSLTSTGEVREYPAGTALPGLIDTHVHLTFSAGPTHDVVRATLERESDDELFLRAAANAQRHLAAGVTSLRDCGGRGNVTLRLRDAARAGAMPLPRISACGPAITTARGHLNYLRCVAEGEPAVRAAAKRVLEEGADFVKICATGGIMTAESDPMAPQYSVPELAAAVEEADARGTLVAAHALSRVGLERCVEAGVRSIEHCLWQTGLGEFDFGPETARTMVERGVVAGLTFSAVSQAGYRAAKGAPVPEGFGPWQARLANRYAAERRMIDAGVAYTVHSDAGVRETPFGDFWVCLATMVHELKVTPVEAIRAATAVPAALLGWADRVGSLTVGRRADLLVVAGDPAAEIEALAQVEAVFLDGAPVGERGRLRVR